MSRLTALDQNLGALERKTPSKTVICGECGERFDLSTRNEYSARMRGEAPICWYCRNPKPLSAAERLALRNWWLERYSREELEEIAFGLWPSLVAEGLTL